MKYSYVNAESRKGNVIVWERRPEGLVEVSYKAPHYMYYEDPEGEHDTMFGGKASFAEFDSRSQMKSVVEELKDNDIQVFDSDISPIQKILSEHYIDMEVPDLHITYLDIEVDYDKKIGFSSVQNPYAPINSVALYHAWKDKYVVLAVPPEGWDGVLDPTLNDIADVILCSDEQELLIKLLLELGDTDGFVGWNSDFFDTPYICKRVQKVLPKKYFSMIGFPTARLPYYQDVELFGRVQTKAIIGGRLSIDYLELFKKFEMSSRPSYSLEAISNDELPHLPKLEYEGTLADLYRKDFSHFIRYNIRDVECLAGFEDKFGYVALANQMYHEATGQFNNILGTVKLAELSIRNYCKNELNVVIPDTPPVIDSGKAQGAYVLEPKAGMHSWLGSVDINSLYPSCIRAVNVSPEKLIGQMARDKYDFEQIQAGTDETVTLIYEDSSTEKFTASEWKSILLERNWSVSGYGTIFNLDAPGVIPQILSKWFDTRGKYKKLKAKHGDDKDLEQYYDRLQYCYKIKLNSLYGALLNKHFKFYDKRLGESTTGTGREILRHMCAKVNETLTGKYDYLGEAIIYGDTDSSYFKTYTDNLQEAEIMADAMANVVNKSFPEFMNTTFCCIGDFAKVIKAEREVVASKGIFVTRKRYMLWVLNEDGKRVEKAKVMGLDIKKNILPKYIQKALTSFLTRLLQDEDWAVIEREIVEYKQMLKNDPDFTILGLPTGVNKVEEGDSLLTSTGARKTKDCFVAGHVRAAVLYNRKREEYGDVDSPIIMSSTKIKKFYLAVPDQNFKSIALPLDIEVIPEWFTKNILIDKDMQIEKLIDNPLRNVIKALGKEPPTEQTLLVQDEFDF